MPTLAQGAGRPERAGKRSPEKALNWRLRRTEAVSPVGVVQAMGLVVLNTPLEKVKSLTCLPSSSTTACKCPGRIRPHARCHIWVVQGYCSARTPLAPRDRAKTGRRHCCRRRTCAQA